MGNSLLTLPILIFDEEIQTGFLESHPKLHFLKSRNMKRGDLLLGRKRRETFKGCLMFLIFGH